MPVVMRAGSAVTTERDPPTSSRGAGRDELCPDLMGTTAPPHYRTTALPHYPACYPVSVVTARDPDSRFDGKGVVYYNVSIVFGIEGFALRKGRYVGRIV